MTTVTRSEKKNIYFARHGERIDFIDKTWKTSAKRVCDPPLSPYGLQQAHELGIYIAQIQPRITHIYASPFLRTIQTAIQVAKEINRNRSSNDEIIKIRLEPGFGELALDNVTWDENTLYRSANELSEISEDIQYIDQDYNSLLKADYYLQTKTETRQKFRNRLQRVFEQLLNVHASDCNMLIITHAAPLIEGVRTLLTISQKRNEEIIIETNQNSDTPTNWDMSPIRAGVCSLTHVELIDHQWTLQKNGLASYLSKGEQNAWIFPDDKHLY